VCGGVTIGGLGDEAGHLDGCGDLDHCGVGFGEAFVITGASPAAGGPCVGPLDDPAARQYPEALLAFGLLDDV
jgi:hypothetical protein